MGHGSQPLARGFRSSVQYNSVLQLDLERWTGLRQPLRAVAARQPLVRTTTNIALVCSVYVPCVYGSIFTGRIRHCRSEACRA